jgi:hypothetical protein
MKLNGQKVEKPEPERIIIPRGKGKDLIFYADMVIDMSPFDKICPAPKPPLRGEPGKPARPDYEAPQFVKKLDTYFERRAHWIFLESLKATPGLEWDTVDYADPSTWKNYESELRSCMSDNEIAEVINGVSTANMVTDKKRKEALERFMSGEEEKAKGSDSPSTGRRNTKSGEPANV